MNITRSILLPFCFLLLFIPGFRAQTWTSLTSGTSASLIGVCAISKDTVYVGGANGKIMKTTNGGVTWVTQTTPTAQTLYGMDFINGNVGFAAGDNGAIIKTSNGGATWTSVSVTSSSLRSVRFISSTTGFITGDGGLILKTTNGGTTWSVCSTGISDPIYAVWFIDPTNGYASSFSGDLLKTTNGGSTWTASATGVSSQMNTIYFTDPSTGTFVGAGGVIRRTTDGGVSWATVTMTPSGDFLHSHTFVNSTTGFITGGNIGSNIGVILNTVDGGLTWSTYHPGTARLCNVDFVNANTGYAVGLNGTILKYTSPIGISEQSATAKTLDVFPNPAKSSFTISTTGLELEGTVYFELFDVAGNLVKKEELVNISNLTIERGSLDAGIYFFTLSTNGKVAGTGKIIFE
ncbi:MAG: hypothetical protein JWO09_1012 [Bacteroidetes bacterium]|nr:hypothetical protein [Bacteroidota bacterium]